MNEMDLLSRMRNEVPPGTSPRSEHLFRTALLQAGDPGRPAAPAPRQRRLAPPGRPAPRGLRLATAPLAVTAATAAVLAMVLPSPGHAPSGHFPPPQPARSHAAPPQPVTPARLLASQAAAAALPGPHVTPGQWVYRELDYTGKAGQSAKASTEELRATADDATQASYHNGSYRTYHRGRNYNGTLATTGFFAEPVSYASLASLPSQPRALATRLAQIGAMAGGMT